jgi:hypothetical protein
LKWEDEGRKIGGKKIMKWMEMREAGERLTPEGRVAQLRSLMTDPRWPAMVSLLEHTREALARGVTSQVLAREHGALAHAAGRLAGVDGVMDQLREVADK